MIPRTPRRTVRTHAVSSVATASPDYEHWTRQDLYDYARDAGISGRSTMSKTQLIAALRAR